MIRWWETGLSTAETFSEFTYSFAVINELVVQGDPPIVSVPVFPSLLREGRAGGGYDVALNRPGRPLFLQFKLSRYVQGSRAREYHASDRVFYGPLYRMYVRSRRSSRQHELLLELERGNRSSVFYCGPAFHTLQQLDKCYRERQIVAQSRFVKPSELPSITDDDEHWISFQEPRGTPTQFFSEQGTSINLDERPIVERLNEDLDRHHGALGDTIKLITHWLERGLADPDVGPNPEDSGDAIARLAFLAHTVLNSTLCILQPQLSRGARP